MRISDWSSDVCSSDLLDLLTLDSEGVVFAGGLDRLPIHQLQHVGILPAALLQAGDGQTAVQQPARHAKRQAVIGSEEHTSELQSLMRISYAVFCLQNTITESKQTQQPNNLVLVRSHTVFRSSKHY